MSVRIERAQAVLQEQLAEINAEEMELRQALAGLNGSPKGAPQKATLGPKRRRAPKRAKKGQRREEVSDLLKANPKAKTSEIAKQIGISTNQVSALKGQLAKEQKSTAGKRRAKRAAPKAARSPEKASAKSGTKKSARKGSRKRKGQGVSKSK